MKKVVENSIQDLQKKQKNIKKNEKKTRKMLHLSIDRNKKHIKIKEKYSFSHKYNGMMDLKSFFFEIPYWCLVFVLFILGKRDSEHR